jgi:hypothetical protein
MTPAFAVFLAGISTIARDPLIAIESSSDVPRSIKVAQSPVGC